jgi:hypothetical protein
MEQKNPPQVTIPFLGTTASVFAYGTYQGDEPHGFTTWHDGEHRKVRKVTAALRCDPVIVNGISYRVRLDFERAATSYGEGPYAVRAGEWRIMFPTSICRNPSGAEPTDKARETIKDAGLRVMADIDADPERARIFIEAEAWVREEKARELTEQAEHDEKRATERRARAALLLAEAGTFTKGAP